MELLTVLLTFLGGGALTSILTYLHSKRKDNTVSKDKLIQDIYIEIERLNTKINLLQVKVDELIDEREELQEELFKRKEKEMELLRLIQVKDKLIEELEKEKEEREVIIKNLRMHIEELIATKVES